MNCWLFQPDLVREFYWNPVVPNGSPVDVLPWMRLPNGDNR